MDSVLYEEWVRDVNKKFQTEGRRVTLIIDNCPAHPIIENLSHIKLVFLLPNTTVNQRNKTKAQGVSGSRRNKISQGPLQETISKADTVPSRFQWGTTEGIIVNSFAIACISMERSYPNPIVNCFKRAKIWEKDQTIAINDEDGLFKEINETLKELREKEPSLLPEDFATVDDAVITT